MLLTKNNNQLNTSKGIRVSNKPTAGVTTMPIFLESVQIDVGRSTKLLQEARNVDHIIANKMRST